MRYAGTRNPRAETNPLRSALLFRSAAHVFGSSARDRMVGTVRKAVQFREGWLREYGKACAELGKANRVPPENRRHAQAAAMRRLNAVRTAMRANLRAITAAEAALAAFDANPPPPVVRPVGGPPWKALPAAAVPVPQASA